jgi:hypothetical protein
MDVVLTDFSSLQTLLEKEVVVSRKELCFIAALS